MLYCKECNYLSAGDAGEAVSKCGFSGFLFSDDIEQLEMDYPCGEISYAQYLMREAKKAEYNILHGQEWKLIYKRNHAKRAA